MKYIVLLMSTICLIGYSQSTVEKTIALSSAIDEEDPQENIQVDTMPRPVTPISPKYPESARKLGIEGIVWLKLIVNEKGEAAKIVVFRSNITNPGKGTEAEGTVALNELNASAVDAAKQWKFNPAVLNGKPIKVWVTVPFKFKLDNSKQEQKTDKKLK